MAIPGPLVGGTFMFIFLGVVACAAGLLLKKLKKLTADDSQ
jgi:hypothetical protein